MTNKIFLKDEWPRILDGLKDSYKVFVPSKDGDYHNFKSLNEGAIPDFDFQNTKLSAKSIVYPQSERMFECSLDSADDHASILDESINTYPQKAIVGIRPCDALGFQIVKRNFDNAEYRDPWWVRNFESTTFIGLGCNNPCSTCFCLSAGCGPFSEKGLDVILYDIGNAYLAKGLTENGGSILNRMSPFNSADDVQLKKAEDISQESNDKIRSVVHSDKLNEKVLLDLFNAPFWEDIAFSCINCGTCTFVCSTCWCFDIQDEVYNKQVDRMRNWDSCMFPLFTLHGSGHNPRSQKFQRVRQRFMHKLKYYVDKYSNGVQCSGCGRCIQNCPVNIDIRNVFELMNNF